MRGRCMGFRCIYAILKKIRGRISIIKDCYTSVLALHQIEKNTY